MWQLPTLLHCIFKDYSSVRKQTVDIHFAQELKEDQVSKTEATHLDWNYSIFREMWRTQLICKGLSWFEWDSSLVLDRSQAGRYVHLSSGEGMCFREISEKVKIILFCYKKTLTSSMSKTSRSVFWFTDFCLSFKENTVWAEPWTLRAYRCVCYISKIRTLLYRREETTLNAEQAPLYSNTFNWMLQLREEGEVPRWTKQIHLILKPKYNNANV